MALNCESTPKPTGELMALRQRVAELETTLARQRQSAAENSRERERFHIALQNSDIIVAHADRDLKYTWIHNPFPNTSPVLVLGKRDDEVSPTAGNAELLRFKSEVLEAGIGARREISFELAHGLRTYAINTEPMRDDSGEVIGVTTAAMDITEHLRVEGLRPEHNQSQLMSQHLVASQESERRRIAVELHDEIGQLLTGVKLTLERSRRAPTEPVKNQLISEAQSLIAELMGRVRNLSMELRPTMLDELGLLPTLDWFVTQYTKLTEVRVMLDPAGVDQRFPPEVETSAYRIFQEALTNVARHAGVDQAKVTIQLTGEDLVVRVEDQGVGFNPTEISALASSGLSGMRERARLLGGQLNLDSAPGQGTRLTARLPVKVKA